MAETLPEHCVRSRTHLGRRKSGWRRATNCNGAARHRGAARAVFDNAIDAGAARLYLSRGGAAKAPVTSNAHGTGWLQRRRDRPEVSWRPHKLCAFRDPKTKVIDDRLAETRATTSAAGKSGPTCTTPFLRGASEGGRVTVLAASSQPVKNTATGTWDSPPFAVRERVFLW
jgi:hypothetical protein